MIRIGVLGGGASGFFIGANLPKSKNYNVTIFEQSSEALQKVKISGGGRCNVTNACFNAKELVENYPRGRKELLSVFSVFQPKDTMDWFSKNGVSLKIEADNRVFPVSNQSSSIVNCLRGKALEHGITEKYSTTIIAIKKENNGFWVSTKTESFFFDVLIITTGSSPKTWEVIKNLGHKIIPPLPSLFTFNCTDSLLKGMAGTSFDKISVKISSTKLEQIGAALITHRGLSGPAILKLSAWGARALADVNYTFEITINWIGLSRQETIDFLFKFKKDNLNKSIINLYASLPITKNFWIKILTKATIKEQTKLSEISNRDVLMLSEILTQSKLLISGKNTFKEEFVTCGGIDLKEINFKTMESKLIPNLYFAGEVLNIDAVTGGFNFQAAWSEAFIISQQLKTKFN
ncbi:MAG: NAD(P)/FAD-dependent oxidoreductase [Solirubrobacteraceae bacterium]